MQRHIKYKYKVSVIDDEISFTYFYQYRDYFYVLVVQKRSLLSASGKCGSQVVESGVSLVRCVQADRWSISWTCWPCAVVIRLSGSCLGRGCVGHYIVDISLPCGRVMVVEVRYYINSYVRVDSSKL